MTIKKYNEITWLTNYLDNYRNIPLLSWTLLFLTFIESIGSGLGFFIAIYFSTYLILSIATIGKILSCYGLGTIAGGWIGGKMVDKISATFTNSLSLFLFGLSFLLLACFRNPFILMMIMFFMGFASYGFIASNSVLILRTAKESEALRLKLLNLKNVASNLGMGIAAVVLGIYGHHDFFYVFVIICILLWSASFYQYKKRHIYESLRLKKSLPMTGAGNAVNLKKLFYTTLACVFAVGLIVTQHKIAYPIFVKSCFTSTTIVSIIFALNPLIIIFLQPAIVNYIEKFNKTLMMGIGAIGLSLGMVILTLSHGVMIFILSVFFYTLGEMIFFSLSQLLCYQSLNEQNKGKAIGMWRVTYATSNVIGPYLGSLVYEVTGAHTVWLICGLLGILCFLMTIYLSLSNWVIKRPEFLK